MRDVAILGGGAIGLASGLALARRGLSVTLVERHPSSARAASRAAAGMLSAQLERHPSEAMAALCHAGRERHRAFLDELERATGRTLDHRPVGALRVAWDEAEEAELNALVTEQRARGWRAELVSREVALALEPGLGPFRAAGWFPEERVVDPPRLLDALEHACRDAGVEVAVGVPAASIRCDGGDGALEFEDGRAIHARRVVLAAGAWSALPAGSPLRGAVRPIRGQMLELRGADVPTRILDARDGYLSPRSDGRVLVGSTLEDVGFDDGTTSEARARLVAMAERLYPALAHARLANHWSGFRSTTADRQPILGTTANGLVIATGHHRNGVVLTAITADIVAALVLDEAPPVDIAPFAPGRFAAPPTEA